MITEQESKRISKFLSLALRHQPELIGIELDAQGWTDITVLIEKSKQAGVHFDLPTLQHIVHTNNKKRFAFNPAGTHIRASQGHSVAVELGYTPQPPPAILYHGTAEQFLPSILQNGLQKQSRQHVHLSAAVDTALAVGGRHGKPVVLEIQAGHMFTDGHHFYLSDNGVWLTDHVPVQYLSQFHL